MKRNATAAQLNWPTSYNAALKRRRTARIPRGAYIINGQRGGAVPGYTRTVGAYRRSLPSSNEKKYFETGLASVADLSAGLIVPSLNLIPQGTTDKTRIGNKVTIRNINMRFVASIDNQTAITMANGILRVILYVDKQANGAAATVADLISVANVTGFRNMDQVDRFTILKDKVYTIEPKCANATSTSTADRMYKISKKVNIPVHFSSTTGAITEVRSNNIGILLFGNFNSVNFAQTGLARIKFTDD